MYAVIETGGKQYRVAAGDVIEVERLPVEAGAQVELERVLMVAGAEGTSIGAPVVEGARVVATVAAHFRGPKIRIFKMKPKKRYRLRMGHRQELTRLKIENIAVGDQLSALSRQQATPASGDTAGSAMEAEPIAER